MGFIGSLVQAAGELHRIKKEENKEKDLDPLTKQLLEELKKRAQNGDVDSMFRLGICYIRGEYVGYNPDDACFWWTEAAKRGCVEAQYNLGLLYEGKISRCYFDPNLAGHWFNIASHNGNPDAYQRVKAYKYNSASDTWELVG